MSTANHLSYDEPVFTAEYLFLGSDTLDYAINIDKAGLMLVNYENAPDSRSWFTRLLDNSSYFYYWYLPTGLLLIYLVSELYDTYIKGPKRELEWSKKRVEIYKKALSESIDVLGKKPEPDDLARYIKYIVERENWEQTSKFDRFITRMKEPKFKNLNE